MSRLLFAAARGARIQKWGSTIQKWFEVTDISLMDEEDGDRTHPDDAHLQYGPISTALREYAATGKWPYTLTAMLAEAAFDYEKWYTFAAGERPHASMFALILAEALADEGL